MKKSLFICFILAFAFIGCEDRVYLDIMADVEVNNLTSAGPFSDIRISYYRGYRNKWTINAEMKTSCGKINIKVEEDTIREAFDGLHKESECLKLLCENR